MLPLKVAAERFLTSRESGFAALKVVIIGAIAVVLAGYSRAVMRQGDPQDQPACQSNLKQFGLSILMYVQDYDERYPPMKFAPQVQNRVFPYVKNKAVFTCPATGAEYLPNPALNYVNLASIKSPATLVMLRDAKPHTDESGKPSWNAGYADGHVKLVSTEPALGRPAPTPPPPRRLTRAERVRAELRAVRAMKINLDRRLKVLEAEERRLRNTR